MTISVQQIVSAGVGLMLVGGTILAAQPRRVGFRAEVPVTAGWNADVNGDGIADFCQVEAPSANVLVCTPSKAGSKPFRGTMDLGYQEGQAFVDFDGDGKQDFCRIVGDNFPFNSHAWCTLSTGTGFGNTLRSPSLDWGYGNTREWKDVNGDKKGDFCRAIGNNREIWACNYSTGTGFGPVVTSRR